MFIPTFVGNQTLAIMTLDRNPGSSPHTWGTPERGVFRDHAPRFIPTCVGNSAQPGRLLRVRTVHPHMRGELMSYGAGLEHIGGSSPHAWGTPIKAILHNHHFRFIPTCVGNSRDCIIRHYSVSVHPHMRGELRAIRPARISTSGSSPPVWGTLQDLQPSQWQNRSIPTCAGNSTHQADMQRLMTVHPHMRGELSLNIC